MEAEILFLTHANQSAHAALVALAEYSAFLHVKSLVATLRVKTLNAPVLDATLANRTLTTTAVWVSLTSSDCCPTGTRVNEQSSSKRLK